MLAKKIAKILRGSATPAQIMMGCVLGAVLGFMPGFGQSPGLIIVLVLSLIVLNANLTLAVLVTVAAKIVSLLLVSVSFGVGRILLDGPTQGLFKLAINMPVLALFGLEYYVTTGGLLLGVVLGIVTGFGMIKTVRLFRTKMAGLEENSERYRKWMTKRWVKLLVFVFVGRGSKESYTATLEVRGKVIRPAGVVFCALVVVLLLMVQTLLSGPLITSVLRQGLELANGATVDLEEADLDLAAGRMTLTGLAMADPNALDTDLFRAATIEADVSATSLLRKQLKLDRVVIRDASSGEKRSVAGRLVGHQATSGNNVETRKGEKTLDDYLLDSSQWQHRLTQIRRWIETLSGPVKQSETSAAPEDGASFQDRLERDVEQLGYRRVAANHLIDGAPRFTVVELLAEMVRTNALNGETLDIRASNVSTHPYLLPEPPSVSIESSGKTLRLRLELGEVCASGGKNSVDFVYRGLAVEGVAKNLAGGGSPPIDGGTIDLALQGSIQTRHGVYLDLPLQVTLHNTTMSVGGKQAPVNQFTISLGLRGPIDNLRIRIDGAKFSEALVAAGAGALASALEGQKAKLLDGVLSDVDLSTGLSGIDLDKVLGGIAKKNSKDKSAAANGDPKKREKSDALRDKARALTEGLFGGKKKKKDNE